MRKLVLQAATTFLVLTGTMSLLATPATADMPNTVVSAVHEVLGASACTFTASTPYRSGEYVFGHGSASCDPGAIATLFVVCLETSYTGQPTTWAVVGVCADASGAGGTAYVPCSRVPMYYRTRIFTVAALPGGDPTIGTIYSSYRVFGCPAA